MNIANTGGTLAAMPNHIGAVDGTVRAAVGPEFDSVDTPVATDAAPADAPFAQALSQRIAKDAAKDDPKSEGSHDASGPDSKMPDAAVVSTDAVPLQDPSKDGKTDAPNDAIANDLAAQLALVSQWAGPASQATAQNASSAVARASSDSLATGKGESTIDQANVANDARALDIARGPDAKEGLAIAPSANTVRSKDERVGQAAGDAARSAETAILSAQPGTLHALSDSNALNPLANIATPHVIAALTSAPTPAPTPPDALRQMVGTPAWSHEVGNAMVRMAIDELQSAALRLNPEHLGPLDVQVRMDNGVAHLAFQAAHADTRAAIEASRPMLEQMFSEQGLKIGDCAVGDTASRNPAFNGDPSQANASSRLRGANEFAADAGVDAGTSAVTMRVTRALGMVDTFA
ncbi:MAG: flagellar hook-length control protein FliK [Burkholderiaceae bacterium]